jgi:magnesium chelatase accessory protein
MHALQHDLVQNAARTRPAKPGQPDWAQDGQDWPNRTASRFITAGGIRWHVQVAGQGPVLLLLHGTGAATHSWRDLLRPLAGHYTVVAPDLPGHGFTEQPDKAGMTLPGMASGVAALLDALGLHAYYAAGHSAGAAVVAQMCLEGKAAPKALVSLNGAMLPLPFHGIAAPLMGPLAKLLAANPFVPMLFSWQAADGRVVQKLLKGTGSIIDATGEKLYARLARRSGHAGAALTMMANWDLATFSERLPALCPRLLLVVGENDRSIPPSDALKIQRLLPAAQITRLPGLGHLAHEERPAELVKIIQDFCQ